MAALQSRHIEYPRYRVERGRVVRPREPIGIYPVCPVAQCEQCNRFGSPTWVRAWWLQPNNCFDTKCGDPPVFEREPVLCMGCLNRVRPWWKAKRIIRENQLLINQIKREITRVNAENRR